MKTILVGYDGTGPAERALRRAAELAGAFGAKVVVVSVAPPHPFTDVGAPGAFGLGMYYRADQLDEPARLDQELWDRHRDQVQALLAGTGISVEFAGVAGEPAQELVDAAEQRHGDLIVVGTHEPGILERLLGGSISQGVARRAHCDVLIVHPADETEQ